MKHKVSVWMFVANNSIYKVLLTIVLSVAIQTGLYWRLILQQGGQVSTLEYLIEQSYVKWAFGAAFLIITAIVCLTGCEFSSRIRYTLMRLPVPEQKFFYVQCVFNILCFVIFWGSQILSMLIGCVLYCYTSGEGRLYTQEIFLTFYRNDFFHSLLPMADITRWIRNLVLVAALGLTSAAVPVYQRQQRPPIVIFVLLGLVLLFFIRPMDNLLQDWLVSAAAVIAAGRSIVGSKACMREESL